MPDRTALPALSLAMLLPSLGTSIANVALPTLATSFGVSSQDTQWVVIVYLLVVTTLIVTVGRLGDLYGRRRLLLSGIATFALAAAGAAVASNLWVLVVARGVQGLGAAIMMSLTVAAVGDMVPKERTGSAMGLLGTVSAVGTALGPSLGGVLVGCLGWQAVFAFMAVAGALAFLAGHQVFVKDTPPAKPSFSPDIPGTLLLVLSLGAFALAATLGPITSTNGMLAVSAAILLVAFVAVELKATAPLVQMRLLRDGVISASLLSIALVSTILMATLVVGPFYLSGVLGLDPAETGLVMSVGPGVAALIGVPAGRLVDRIGNATASLSGLAGVMLGSILMTMLPQAFGVAGYVASLALITAGYAQFQAASNTAVMHRAGRDHRGLSSALLGLARNLGLITGASAMGAVFALGSRGIERLALAAGGETGLQATFAAAAALATLALVVTWRGVFRHAP